MKKLLAVIIVLLVAILMALTVPDKQKHKDAMMEAVNEYVEEEAVDKLGDNVLAKLGKSEYGQGLNICLYIKLE